ncbi:RNA polymerase III RPC4-domain-containing protein [Pseudomassariella vexata]|uniref:RNA polymerase III RPC4-domain-containing protein n=1 Tax=Pseudomassariella vexata TaxID=1141098 RepID=A0A1Y2EJR7_9PEZI|nr:RNA polymerase III RPC4-domain-containing protein [Pseudomassariella vexata]ORY71812.1 RNA polymerase III RPC4-domain-containing protein [Pseudomassariella vexata]
MAPRGSRGGTRGARGARAGRGGHGASSAAAASVSQDDGPAPVAPDGDVVIQDAPAAPAAPAAPVAPVANMNEPQADRPATIDSTPSRTESATPASSARGVGRFRPKNVRRDASERQRLEEERRRDLSIKIKVEEKEQRDAERRARRGRGRGAGDSSRGGMIRRTVVGTGLLSGVPAESVRQGGGSSGVSGWRSSYKSGAKSEYGPRYHDRKANENRVNIDAIRENAEPSDAGSGSRRSPGNLPVGILRHEYKEEDVKVATSAELEAEEQEDDDNLFVDNLTRNLTSIGMADDNAVWHAAPAHLKEPNVKEPAIKLEPGMEGDVMDLDDSPAVPKTPLSPELKKPEIDDADMDGENEVDAKEKALEKKRERALQDPELQAMANDTRALLEEFDLDQKDGRLYLFQFPPILPPLQNLDSEGNVVDLVDNNAVVGPKVKREPNTAGPQLTSDAMPAAGGFIGKLNVRKSGKVELDWGGRILDLGIATPTDFLTSTVIIDEQENDLASGVGKATGMGNVYSKFVLTPIFNEEEDWEPNLDGLYLGP